MGSSAICGRPRFLRWWQFQNLPSHFVIISHYFSKQIGGGHPIVTADAGYTYDGEGRRVKKVSADETTIFVYDASGVLIAEYSGEVAAEPRVSYLTTDHLGSPRVTTNERGMVVNRRDFMAFGEEAVSVQRVGGASGNGYEATGVTRKDYTGYKKDGRRSNAE